MAVPDGKHVRMSRDAKTHGGQNTGGTKNMGQLVRNERVNEKIQLQKKGVTSE